MWELLSTIPSDVRGRIQGIAFRYTEPAKRVSRLKLISRLIMKGTLVCGAIAVLSPAGQWYKRLVCGGGATRWAGEAAGTAVQLGRTAREAQGMSIEEDPTYHLPCFMRLGVRSECLILTSAGGDVLLVKEGKDAREILAKYAPPLHTTLSGEQSRSLDLPGYQRGG